jgi:hypothetical protein
MRPKKKLMKRADGSYSQRGLWDNIRAKRRKGGKMRERGEEGAPTDEAMRRSKRR